MEHTHLFAVVILSVCALFCTHFTIVLNLKSKLTVKPRKTMFSGNLYTYNSVFSSNLNEAVAIDKNLQNYANNYHNCTLYGFTNITILRIFNDIFDFSK